MRRRYLMVAAILAFALSTSACSGRTTSVTKTTIAPMTEAPRKQDSKEQASKEQIGTDPKEGNALNASKGVLTGIVDVNKEFMTTVTSDEGLESYVSGLDERQSETYEDIKPEDAISITYTDGLPSPDNMGMAVIDIEVE